MQRKYSAIDLRGYPSPLYEKVCQVVPVQEFPPHKKGLMGVEVETFSHLKDLPKADLVFARGGTVQKNRKFLGSQRIHVLACPYPFDTFQARLAADNKVALEICFREIETPTTYLRVRMLARLHTTIHLARKYHAPLVITSGAQSEEEVKSPRELVAFGRILGLSYGEAKASIYMIPQKVLGGFL